MLVDGKYPYISSLTSVLEANASDVCIRQDVRILKNVYFDGYEPTKRRKVKTLLNESPCYKTSNNSAFCPRFCNAAYRTQTPKNPPGLFAG